MTDKMSSGITSKEEIKSILSIALLGVSTRHAAFFRTVTWRIPRRRTRRGCRVTPLRKRGWRTGSRRQVRVPPIIEYNLLLHRLHFSILPFPPAAEHDSLPCFSEQSASTDAPDVDINHADVPRGIAHLLRRLGGVGSILVPHRTGHVLCAVGDEVVSRMLEGGEEQVC